MAQLEIKKMKQGMSYSCKEKTIILNVFKYFCQQFPDKCVTDLVRRTAKATGCSEKSVFQFRKEEASTEGFKEPSKTKIRKNININSRDIKYDNNVRQSIRDIIYNLKYRNIVPSLNTILKQVNADAQLPNLSLMTLRRLLFDMGFCYEKNGNKSILVEKQEKETGQKQNNKKAITQSNNTNINNSSNTSVEHLNNSTNNVVVKPGYDIHNDNNAVTNQVHPINNPQAHRIMHVHVAQPENHMVSQSSDGIHFMINRGDEFITAHQLPPPLVPLQMRPVNMDVHLQRDVPLWMPPPMHNMVKQQ